MDSPTAQFSALLDTIYHCAVHPEDWPRVLELLCLKTDCLAGTILSTDLTTKEVHHFYSWNFSDDVLARIAQYGDESAKVWQTLPGFWFRDLDEPGTSMREAPVTYGQSRWVREVMSPLGIVDSLHLILIRSSERVADLALFRHARHGLLGDDEVASLRAVAPHLRRAIEIGNALEMKSLEAALFRATFDALPSAILLVDALGRLQHVNAAAQALLGGADASELVGLRVDATMPSLRQALGAALRDALGGVAAALDLGSVGEPRIAYVMPLPGERRGPSGSHAAAALIIVPPASMRPADIGLAVRLFGLTPAELRLLPHLLSGRTLAEIARTLGLSESTVKTQRMSIFAKTGVSHRADLTRLMAQFMPL